jgi:peptidyl-prolyl cis-trans isomerase C
VILRKWLREPLVHFLLAGVALFLAASWIWPAPDAGRVITVTRADMLAQLQARAQVYDEEGFNQLIDNMSPEERAQLVRDTAETEALYREGEALGLADADQVIRARVIQQMRLLLMEEAAADVSLSDEEVRAFYEANKDRYAEGPSATFTHAFFSTERRGVAAEGDARAALQEMNAKGISFADAGQYGDRFLYQRNYADADRRAVEGEFGGTFADALFALKPGSIWQGPLQSEYGWHVVGLTALEPSRVPAFKDIADRVREDALTEARSKRAIEAVDRLMKEYEVVSEE